jgi:hypothetical protein
VSDKINDMLQTLIKFNKYNELNTVAHNEWLACLLCISEVQSSILGLVTGFLV